MEVCSLDALWTPQYFIYVCTQRVELFRCSWAAFMGISRATSPALEHEQTVWTPSSLCLSDDQNPTRGATSRPTRREFVNAAPRKSMNYLKRKNTAKPIGCSWKYFSCFTFGRSGCLIFRDESNASVVKPFAVTHCNNVLQHFSWINSDSLPVHTHNDLFRL